MRYLALLLLAACGGPPTNVFLTVVEPKDDVDVPDVAVPDTAVPSDAGAPDVVTADAPMSDAPMSDAAPVACKDMAHNACISCCQTPAGLAVIANALKICVCRGNACQSECGTYDWNADAGTGTPYCSGGPQNAACEACLVSLDNNEAGGCGGAVEEACGGDPACYGMTGCESSCTP